jgi:hypothetical protein
MACLATIIAYLGRKVIDFSDQAAKQKIKVGVEERKAGVEERKVALKEKKFEFKV